MTQKKAYIKYISSLLLFGSNGIIAGQVLLPSTDIVFWRTLIGSVLLAALLYRKKQIRKTNRRSVCGNMNSTRDAYESIGKYLYPVLSGILMGLSWIFLYAAYDLVGVSLSSLAYYCGPVIVMALAPLLFHEKITGKTIIGFGCVIAGVVLTNGAVEGTGSRLGLAYGFLSAVMHAGMVIFSKKTKGVGGLENSAIQLVVSFLTTAVSVAAVTGLTTDISVAAISGLTVPATAADWLWIIVLGICNTGIGCYLYFSSIGALPVQTVSVLGYLEPLSSVLLAVLLLREPMTAAQWIGAALVIGGAGFSEIANFHGKKHPV